jgi:hypothetical protein
MKIVNFVLAVMFLAFAFVQVNDPDPIHWILIYGAMAVVSIMAAYEFYPIKFLIGLLVIYAGYSIVFIQGLREWLAQEDKSALFSEIAKMEHLYIEESREFLGLLICMIVLAFYLIRARMTKR